LYRCDKAVLACSAAAAAADTTDDAMMLMTMTPASWLTARPPATRPLVRFAAGITVIRDIISALFGTRGNNPLGSLRS